MPHIEIMLEHLPTCCETRTQQSMYECTSQSVCMHCLGCQIANRILGCSRFLTFSMGLHPGTIHACHPLNTSAGCVCMCPCSDSGSPIQSLSYGLGRSTRDVLVQGWQSLTVHATNTYTVTVKVPFGVDIWVRVQVQNRGESVHETLSCCL